MISKKIATLINSVYDIGEIIGHGTFGVVYKGFNKNFNYPVAIKIFSHGDEISRNFINESKLIFRLKHPHVTQALDLFYTEDCYAIVFEYMNQGDLRGYIEQFNALSEYQTLIIAAQVVAGLDYIHNKGIIHRDLKPENILIASSKKEITYKLTDFNISSYSKDRKLPPSEQGSPIYMAPEQFYDQYDLKVDLYALGIIMFEMLSGKPPFMGTLQEVKKAHISKSIDFSTLKVSPHTQQILKVLLQKQPSERYHSAKELLDNIEKALGYITLPSQLSHPELTPKTSGVYYLKYLDNSLWPGYVTALNIKRLNTLA